LIRLKKSRGAPKTRPPSSRSRCTPLHGVFSDFVRNISLRPFRFCRDSCTSHDTALRSCDVDERDYFRFGRSYTYTRTRLTGAFGEEEKNLRVIPVGEQNWSPFFFFFLSYNRDGSSRIRNPHVTRGTSSRGCVDRDGYTFFSMKSRETPRLNSLRTGFYQLNDLVSFRTDGRTHAI